jgi:hypothetical protein
VSKHNVEDRGIEIVWVYSSRGIKRVYLTDGIILSGTGIAMLLHKHIMDATDFVSTLI